MAAHPPVPRWHRAAASCPRCPLALAVLQAGGEMCSRDAAVSRGSDGSPSRLTTSHLAEWWPGGSGSRTWGTIKSGFFSLPPHLCLFRLAPALCLCWSSRPRCLCSCSVGRRGSCPSRRRGAGLLVTQADADVHQKGRLLLSQLVPICSSQVLGEQRQGGGLEGAPAQLPGQAGAWARLFCMRWGRGLHVAAVCYRVKCLA